MDRLEWMWWMFLYGSKWWGFPGINIPILLLMEDILLQLVGSFSHYLQGFIDPRWCRISAINSITQPDPNLWSNMAQTLPEWRPWLWKPP